VNVCMLAAKKKGLYDLYGEEALKQGVPDGKGGNHRWQMGSRSSR
jgi:hypothetical protein